MKYDVFLKTKINLAYTYYIYVTFKLGYNIIDWKISLNC